MDNWVEVKTAYYVAKLGTVTAAAKALGIHRATVLRHIDCLESDMGDKLFVRHPKGYAPTDIGLELLRVAQDTEIQFEKLFGLVNRKSGLISGDLIITSIELICPLILPSIHAFHQANPNIMVRYVVDEEVLKLEYGEAHIAIRAGQQPQGLESVVQPFCRFKFGLYAHQDYINQYGLPKTVDDFKHHRFVGSDNPQNLAPFIQWLQARLPTENLVFRSENHPLLVQAIKAAEGIGFVLEHEAENHPELVQVMAPKKIWDVNFWLVTHGDLHRSSKVQTFLSFLKDKKNQTQVLQNTSIMK